jgi:hypothetical protein
MGRVGAVESCADGEAAGRVGIEGRTGRRDGAPVPIESSAVASSAPSAADSFGLVTAGSCDGDVIGPLCAGIETGVSGREGVAYGSMGLALAGGPMSTLGGVIGEGCAIGAGGAYGSMGHAPAGGPPEVGCVELVVTIGV